LGVIQELYPNDKHKDKEQKTMVKMIERVQAQYESHEMPFGKTYEWHPAYLVLECGCGKKWTIDTKSTITTCQCGRDLANFLARAIQDGEATLPEEFSRPWFYDAKERAQQHQRDEEAYPEGSPWRYDDITVATNEE
jgi:hypothetical protein